MAVTILHYLVQLTNINNDVINKYIQDHLVFLVAGIQRVMDSLHNHNQYFLMVMNETATMNSESEKDIADMVSLFYKTVLLLGGIYGFDMEL